MKNVEGLLSHSVVTAVVVMRVVVHLESLVVRMMKVDPRNHP